MNSLVLIMVVIGVFAMGYRFYAKFLTLGVFRIDNAAPTPASHRHDSHDFVRCNRWILLSQHTAAVAGSTTLIGAGVAVIWGWVPAFLWIVVGTVVVAGAYAIGTLWASLRYSGVSPHGLARELVGSAATIPFLGLAGILLMVVCAVLPLLIGEVLVANPSATWLFLSLIPVTICVRRSLFAANATHRLVNSGLVLFILVAAFLAGQYLPLAIAGAWRIPGSNRDLLVLGPGLIWSVVVLIMGYLSVKDPVWRTARPRGVLAGIVLLVAVLLMVIGIGIFQPDLSAPRINEQVELPSPAVLIPLVLTGGAFAGYHALIHAGPTVRQIEHQQDAPLLGYGGVVGDGLLAITAVIALTAGFADTDGWHRSYVSWPQHEPIVRWLNEFIDRGAQIISMLGIPHHWASALTAFMVATLTLSALETALRSFGFLLTEGREQLGLQLNTSKILERRVLVLVIAMVAFGISQTQLDLDYWYLINVTGQWLAPAVFVLIVIALSRLGRSTLMVLIPPVVLAPVLAWGTLWVMWEWWKHGLWLLLITASVVLLLGLWGLTVTTMTAFQIHRQQASAMPLRPPGL
jgi:carbon starvation protein